MAFKFTCGVMEVGNSTVMVLPKAILANYPIKKGKKLNVFATDNGIYIDVKQNNREVKS